MSLQISVHLVSKVILSTFVSLCTLKYFGMSSSFLNDLRHQLFQPLIAPIEIAFYELFSITPPFSTRQIRLVAQPVSDDREALASTNITSYGY